MRDRRSVKALIGKDNSLTLNSNQEKIIGHLNVSPEGLTAKEISEEFGITHAGALFLLKPLIDAGIVQRIELRGGGVLYYLPFKIREKLTAEVEQEKNKLERLAGKPISKMTLDELHDHTRGLSENSKDSILRWALEGGWKEK